MAFQRLYIPVFLLLITFVLGSSGYYLLGIYGLENGLITEPWTVLNCAFMTAVSLTTVGYGEYVPLNAFPAVKIYTIILLFAGMGIVLYGVSEATSFFVEGHLKRLIERRRLMKKMKTLHDHIILCGLGDTGGASMEELVAINVPFVAIDSNEELVEKLIEKHPNALFITGDAGDEDVLKQGGIDRAQGLIACLDDDRDNVVLTLTARCLNPSIKIVARAKHISTEQKLRAAGANQVVTPTITGGMRLASEMIRPHITSFLDTMLRRSDIVRFGEVELPQNSPLAGLKITESGIREKTGLHIVALRNAAGDYQYNLDIDRPLTSGDVLIAIGTVESLDKLKRLCEGAA